MRRYSSYLTNMEYHEELFFRYGTFISGGANGQTRAKQRLTYITTKGYLDEAAE